MCGIAGLWRYKGNAVETLETMCSHMSHRGPDDEGYYHRTEVHLGHRRLSIIDLEGGHQPLFNETGSIAVVFNGEIYNHEELREDLLARGHRFATRSDTEVLVHLYEEHGDDMVNLLNGMFAFAIHDSETQRIFLARDHVGIKPLFIARFGETVAFASELGAIAEAFKERLTLEPRSLIHYMADYYIPDPLTIYRQVSKLPAAHAASIDARGFRSWRYWKPGENAGTAILSYEDAVERLDELLSLAVKRQRIADVPVGAFLSGGTDSSCVVAHMAAQGGYVRTFNVGFTGSATDEREYAREIAKLLATEHEELPEHFDAVGLVEKLIPRFGEPFADSSALPTYLVSRKIREHVTVALSGDGGDELFAGYLKYDVPDRERILSKIPWPIRRALPKLADRLPSRLPGVNLLYGYSLDPEEAALLGIGRRFASRLYSKELLDVAAHDDPFRFLLDRAELPEGLDIQTRLQLLDMQGYLPGDILTKVDRMSMAVSLEARVPLLDREIVEFAFSLPVEYKLRMGERKAVLKSQLERYLPSKLVRRPKLGFGVPIDSLLAGPLKPMLMELLSANSLNDCGIFNKWAVANLLDEHFNGRRDYSQRLWQLLVLVLWWRHARPFWG